jgi:AraC-like DNA-binding protein/tetratricopeptide (TPR) repeat protein
MHKIKNLLLYLFLLCYNCSIAQQFATVPDSLKKYSYDDLYNKVVINQENDSLIHRKNYIYAYTNLLKSKKENNSKELVYGYLLMVNAIPDFSLAMKYSDSACSLSRNKMPNLISRAYFDRGYLYYTKNKLKDALDCFIIASRDTIHPSKYLHNRINYSIGMIKNTQGDYQDALPIYIKCERNARTNKFENYLNCLLGLSEVYNRTNNITLSEQCTNKGIALRKKDDSGEIYYPYFIANQGKNQYKRKQYDKAILDLMLSIEDFKKSEDHSNYAENSFFIGECYREQHLDKKAIRYYKKVDSVFTAKNNIYPLTIPAYEHLIAYYKKKQDYQQVIYYSDQFIKADKVVNENYKYIASKIAKTYDIQNVVASKQALIASLNNDKKLSFFTIFLLSFGVTGLGVFYLFKSKQNRKELLKQKEQFDTYKLNREEQKQGITTIIPLTKPEIDEKETILDVDEKIATQLSKCLENFEQKKDFLKEYTLEIMAKEFNTNSTYLYKVIKHTRKCSFNTYINALRIEYIVEKLQTEKRYRTIRIEVLSKEAGYNSTKTFTRAFLAYTNEYPSNYINNL